jgi:hypothetical protein
MSEEEGNGGHGFFWFVVGIIFGIAGTIFVPQWAAPYLPDFLGGGARVEGEVLDKVTEADRILVKVTTTEGLILATFTQHLAELDLLVQPGDSITLGLDGYEPFVANPPVERVVGSTVQRVTPEPEPARETDESEDEVQEDMAEPSEPEVGLESPDGLDNPDDKPDSEADESGEDDIR